MNHTEASKRATRLVTYVRIDSRGSTFFECYRGKQLRVSFDDEHEAETWVERERAVVTAELEERY